MTPVYTGSNPVALTIINKHKTTLEDNSVQRIVSPLRISLLREMDDIDDSLYHPLVDISDYVDESSKGLSRWDMCESCRA